MLQSIHVTKKSSVRCEKSSERCEKGSSESVIFGFMHIARVAQSCRLENKAVFVQSHHESKNPSKKFIGTRISRFTEQHIGVLNRPDAKIVNTLATSHGHVSMVNCPGRSCHGSYIFNQVVKV